MKKIVVLMNMGASRNKKEFKQFLSNMFFDEQILPIKNRIIRKIVGFFIVRKILKKNWKNFEKIGGKSPMHEITESLVKKLQRLLPKHFITYSMRYTEPSSQNIINELKLKNIKDVILFPLYPHNSITTNISSFEDFENKSTVSFSIKKIDYFYENTLFNEAIIEKIIEKVSGNFEEYEFIFSAHSLPKRVIEMGDSYEKHINNHIKILQKLFKKHKMNFNSISLAYQSMVGKEKWLEPSLDTVLKKMNGKKIIIYPISFVIDNSETVYELDIEYRELAIGYGIKEYILTECVNDSDTFCEMLAGEIKK